MKRWLFLGVTLALGLAAIVVGQRLRPAVTPSADPILYLIADAERDLTRIPVALTPLSDKEEVAIGDKIAARYEANDPQPDNESKLIADYLRTVGANVAKSARRKLKYRFHYVSNDSLVNAFALPGGHVFMGKGLLELMETEDELASILGHEIEHIELRHPAERVQIHSRLEQVPIAGLILSLPVALFQAGYSKQQELDADREGTALAVAGGYSAQGAVSMFRRFEELEAQWHQASRKPARRNMTTLPGEIVQVTLAGSLEGYFRSHPPSTWRREQIERLIEGRRFPARKSQPLRIAYMLRRDQARNALNAGEIPRAEKLARQALALNPDYPSALNLVADIDMEQAAFPEAADLYRKSLNLDPKQEQIITRYAVSLAVSQAPAEALRRYQEWLHGLAPDAAPAISRVEEAGLRLLTGDTATPTGVSTLLLNGPIDQRSHYLARMAWWRLRAGDSTGSQQAAEGALELNPQTESLTTQVVWTLLAQQKYDSAQKLLTNAANAGGSEFQILLALIAWETRHDAMTVASSYQDAIMHRKAWQNSRWVTAMYGPRTEESLGPIRREWSRLKKSRFWQ